MREKMATSFAGKQLFGLALSFAVAVIGARICYRWLYSKKEKESYVKVLFFPDKHVACRTHFTQRNGCLLQRCRFSHDPQSSYAQLLGFFKNAQRCIDLCVYMITCTDLADVVLELQSKGIIVRIITDSKEIDASGSQIGRFRENRIQVRHNASSYLMHHKFIVIDRQFVSTGSFNWTRQAITGNCENLIITNQQFLVDNFLLEFEKLWQQFDLQLQSKGLPS